MNFYIRAALGLAAIAALAWVIHYAHQSGYREAMADQQHAVNTAVAAAKIKWEASQDNDKEIVNEVVKTEIEYRDRVKVVVRDIIKWRPPNADCTDLGDDFRMLFNRARSPAGVDTSGTTEPKTAVRAPWLIGRGHTTGRIDSGHRRLGNPRALPQSG